MALDLGITFNEEGITEERDALQIGQDERNRNRRNRLDRIKYDKMEKAERQTLALEKLQSDEFETLLKRYYTGGVSDMNGGKKVNDYSKTEIIEKFYQDRLWSEYNTVGIVNDVGQVLAKDDQYKGDWAEITQLYADLPYFGGQTIGFVKWAKDFVPALIADPINLFTLGTGKIVAREAGKVAISALSKQEFQKLAVKQSVKEIALKEAAYGAAIATGSDLARQTAEKDAGLMTDYNLTRTLITGTTGGVAQGTVGGAMSVWSTKGKAGKFYDKGDGFLSDFDRDFGAAGSKADVTYSGKDGKSKKFKPENSSLKNPTKVTDRQSEIPTIASKVNEIKEKTFLNSDITVLPKELQNAKPRYNYGDRSIELEFDNDIAKALYIVGGKGKSVSHDSYLSFLKNAGVKDISKKAQAIRDSIKAQAKSGSDTAKISAELPTKVNTTLENDIIKARATIAKIKKTLEGKGQNDEGTVLLGKATRKYRELLAKQKGEVKRKTPFINLNKISADSSHNVVIKEIKGSIKTLLKNSDIRTTQRVGLFNQIKSRAATLLGKKNAEKLNEELITVAKIAPDLAPTIYAGRINIMNKSVEVAEIRKLADNAVDLNEKLAVTNKLLEALAEKTALVKNHVRTVEGVSDALNQQKIIAEMTGADKLRMDTDILLAQQLPELLAKIKKLKPSERIKAVSDIAEISENDFKMRKFIKDTKNKSQDKTVTGWEALNEYTTANLLGDPTTHEINLLSAGVRFQASIIEQFYGGLISVYGGKRLQGLNQLQMAGDLLVSQMRFFQIAFKKAKLSWKANRSIGDTIEHRFDGRVQRNMETYFDQLRESDNVASQVFAKVASPIGKLSFLTLKLLGAGDTLMKNIFQRTARVAVVNQRIRKFYPELWKNRKMFNKTGIVKVEDNIRNVKENIRFEKAADKINEKKLIKLNKQLTELEKQKVEQTPFEKKWQELYYQYEDEFGNFRKTKTFNSIEVSTLDDLTKSVSNDPTFVSQVNSFTQKLKSDMLESNQFYPDQKQSEGNVGDFLLKFVNKVPAIRVLTGLHFVKTPVSLFKYGWHTTPYVNRLNKEFNGMRHASDPIVRNKATSLQVMGMTTFGLATSMQLNGRLTGHNEKDRNHRYSYVWYNEKGEKQFTNLKRFFPLSIPFMVVASIGDALEEGADMLNDPLHSNESQRYQDFLTHMGGSAFAVWSNIFASNLMTQDFFKLTQMFSETEADIEEGAQTVSKLSQYGGRTLSKLIPEATTWRWTNKVFGDAEAELVTMLDHVTSSTPFELSKIINEKYLDGRAPILNYGDALSPKSDPLGNTYIKPKGLLLGNAQDMFPVRTHWSNAMVDSNGKKIILSKEARTKLENSNILWERPQHTIQIGTKIPLNMKKIQMISMKLPQPELDENNKIKEYPKGIKVYKDGTTMYEVLRQIKQTYKIGGMTINEKFQYELENSNSDFNKTYATNQMLGGKYIGDDYLLKIIRDYEREARDWIKQYGLFEMKNKVATANGQKEIAEKIRQNELLGN